MQNLIRVILLFALLVFPATPWSAAQQLAGRDQEDQNQASSCLEHLSKVHSSATDQAQLLEQELLCFQILAEQALSLRAITIKIGQELKGKADQDLPLSGQDLSTLSQGINEHLAIREKLLEIAKAHECWLNFSPAKLSAHKLDPRLRLKGVTLSLAAALVLYDNYLLSISLFEGDPKLRRLLNEGDPGYAINKAALEKITLSYNSISNRQRVRNGINFYEAEVRKFPQGFATEPGIAYLTSLIAQSPSYGMVKKWSPFYVLGRKLGFLGALTSDNIHELERDGVSLFSMLFGNTVGLVETRKGKLFDQQDLQLELLNELHSGDILLEKTPFRLTDKLIPGYWGHAAVWIGTEQELRQLGIWKHPVVADHHREIRTGRMVVEALRSGVEMNPLELFLNIDSIGVLRQPDQTDDQRRQAILQALRQVGKPYDFNFDVESNESVYCSKLIYISYYDIEWPVKRSLGRTTFTPDDIASLAVGEGELELVYFYHDGKRIEEQPQALMASLMETD